MSKILLFTILMTLPTFASLGQEVECDSIYSHLDRTPVYGESNGDLMNYFSRKITLTERCRPLGRLHFTFVIDKKGKVIESDVSGLPEYCKKNVLEQIADMDQWTPGEVNGEPVCSKFGIVMYMCFK